MYRKDHTEHVEMDGSVPQGLGLQVQLLDKMLSGHIQSTAEVPLSKVPSPQHAQTGAAPAASPLRHKGKSSRENDAANRENSSFL